MTYELFQSMTAAVVRFFTGAQFSRLLDHAPAQLAALARSDAALQSISVAQVFSALVSAVFAFVLIYAVIKKRELAVRPEAAPDAVAGSAPVAEPVAGALRGRWEVVRAHLDSSQEAEWKVAVMEADKLVDDALARAGFPGSTFGDRLTNIQPGTLLSLDGIWWAHRIRNRLAHELDYFLRYTEAKQAVGYYEQALTELQLL